MALSLTSSPCITSDLELLPMVFSLLPSAKIGGPHGLALETIDIQNVGVIILVQYA